MRLTITIDNIHHEIDSTDPELLGRWIIEIIGRVQWSPATYSFIQVFPSFIFDPATKQYRPDWVADSRIIGQVMPFRTPKELLAALSDQLENAELMKESGG